MASVTCFRSVLLVFVVVLGSLTLSTAEDAGSKEAIRITTLEEKPYVVLKAGHSTPPTNADFDGFIPELLQRLAAQVPFDYRLSVVADGKYGQKDAATGEWSGLIGDVVHDRADLAAAAITVSSARENVVDFTVPFMKFDSAILMKRSNLTEGIRSLSDLADQTDIAYGAIRGGVTESYFRRNPESNSDYAKMWQYMSSTNSGVTSTHDAIVRVREGHSGRPYAFITEGSSADFWSNEPPCDLIARPIKMAERRYALAVRKDMSASTKQRIDAAIEKMERDGELEQLRAKWWGVGQCSGTAGLVAARLTLAVVVAAISWLVAVV